MANNQLKTVSECSSRQGWWRVIALVACMSLALPSEAELYKWVDEQGRTHFSNDKVDVPDKQKITVIPLPDGKQDPAPLPLPPKLPADTIPVRHTLMRDPMRVVPRLIMLARPMSEEPKEIGTLRSGPTCRKVAPLQWPAIRNLRNSDLAPTPLVIGEGAARALTNFDYSVLHVSPETVLIQQRAQDGLLLQVDVSKIVLEACSPEERKQLKTSEDPAKSLHFSRYQLQLELEWVLFSRTGDELFKGQTVANTGGLKIKNSLNTVYFDAMTQSVMQLLGNAQFQQAIDAPFVPVAGRQTGGTDKSEEGALSGTMDTLSSWMPSQLMQRMQLSTVLAEMSQLKTVLLEYYMSEGHWPSNLDQIGITTSPVVNGAKIFVEPGGVIVANLPDSFGENKTLLLRAPDDPTQMGANWLCETNVEAKPDVCKGI